MLNVILFSNTVFFQTSNLSIVILVPFIMNQNKKNRIKKKITLTSTKMARKRDIWAEIRVNYLMFFWTKNQTFAQVIVLQ